MANGIGALPLCVRVCGWQLAFNFLISVHSGIMLSRWQVLVIEANVELDLQTTASAERDDDSWDMRHTYGGPPMAQLRLSDSLRGGDMDYVRGYAIGHQIVFSKTGDAIHFLFSPSPPPRAVLHVSCWSSQQDAFWERVIWNTSLCRWIGERGASLLEKGFIWVYQELPSRRPMGGQGRWSLRVLCVP